MRSILVSFGILATVLGSAVEKQFCAADVCSYFVSFWGEEPDSPPDAPSRRADCSSFLLTTVTPTSYATTTILDYTLTIDPTLVNRQASEIAFTTAHVMPSYAVSACNSPEEYASACSCWGISGSTATAPAVTSTETFYWVATPTATATTTASDDPPTTTPTPNDTTTTTTPIITTTGCPNPGTSRARL